MKIEVAPGDELVVTLEGTDGEFRIAYDVGGSRKLQVFADCPDDKGRGGDLGLNAMKVDPSVPDVDPEIYCEDFSDSLLDPDTEPEPEMEFVELSRALDGLMAYDCGATDAGIHDSSLKARVVAHLNGLDDKTLRWTLARYVCFRFVGRDAVENHSGLADVRELMDWMDENDINWQR